MKNFINLESIKLTSGSVRSLIAVFLMFFSLAFTSNAQTNFVARDIAVQRLTNELNNYSATTYPAGTTLYTDALNKASFYKTILTSLYDGQDVETSFNAGLTIFRIQGKPSISRLGADQTEVTETQLKKITADGLKLLSL